MSSAIGQMAKSAKSVPAGALKRAEGRLKKLPGAISRGKAVRSSMLGIEKTSRKALNQRLSEMRTEQEDLQKMVDLGSRYRIVSLDPLGWRDRSGVPKLVIFSLESPDFVINTEGQTRDAIPTDGGKGGISPMLPEPIRSRYYDVWNRLVAEAQATGSNILLRTQFRGVIPGEVKDSIAEAKEFFGDNIFIVAEPNGFKVTNKAVKVPEPKPTPDPDPIVIGWDGERAWLIAAFDVTDVEGAMLEV